MVVFFKQKTAYEMRISDWSSDVCSSDLHLQQNILPHALGEVGADGADDGQVARQLGIAQHMVDAGAHGDDGLEVRKGLEAARRRLPDHRIFHLRPVAGIVPGADLQLGQQRSEEHTSELQSLMRTSYDVFCLKKKQNRSRSKH